MTLQQARRALQRAQAADTGEYEHSAEYDAIQARITTAEHNLRQAEQDALSKKALSNNRQISNSLRHAQKRKKQPELFNY
jgi:hypothetical protein